MVDSSLAVDLNLAFTNTAGLPIDYDDPLLSTGSLLLMDFAHPVAPLTAVPANNQVLYNIAQNQALAVIGSSTAADVSPVVKVGAFTGTAGLWELTPKGGLHGISPQAGTAVTGSGPSIYIPLPVIAYILAHSTHSYYASVWGESTRLPTSGYNNSTWFDISGNGQQTNSALASVNANPASATAPAIRTVSGFPQYVGSAIVTSGSAVLAAVGNTGWYTVVSGTAQPSPASIPGDGTQTSITGPQAGGVIPWGSSSLAPGIGSTGVITNGAVFDPTSNSSNKDKADSHIIYRVYLEDLTISGRTYATVEAADGALFTAAFGTGGRFNGDTFTNPTTIP